MTASVTGLDGGGGKVPTTVAQGFRTLRVRTNITAIQTAIVARRQNNVRSAVAAEMEVTGSFLTGSYVRSTLVAPLAEADVDIVVVLHSKYAASGATNVLDRTRRALLAQYDTPKVSRNGQAVTITFTDFKVDVVPAFERSGGGLLICDSTTNSWIATDPQRHIQQSAVANQAHSGNLVPMVKMLKAWNKHNGEWFRSFHLEVLAWQIFSGVTISNDWSGVRYFFDKARATAQQVVPDPAGYGADVAGYIDTLEKARTAHARFSRAHEIAHAAEAHGNAGRTNAAFVEWRKLFGDYFPGYA